MIMNNSTDTNFGDLASCPYAVSIFFTTAIAAISMAAIIGNILVIVTVYKKPGLRTSTKYYYVNMAVSDFLSCLTTWPLYITDDIITSSGSLLQGPQATAGCKLGLYVRTTSSIVSILSLVLIAVDRFIATVFPLNATLIKPKIRAAFLLATWLISTAFSLPVLSFCEVKQVGQKTFCKFLWNGFAITIYLIATFFVFLLAPLISIVALYSRIMRALRKRVKPEGNTKEQNRNKQNQNIMKIFKSTVMAFFVRFLLLTIFLAFYSGFPEFFLKDNCNLLEGLGYFVFPLLGTAINPLILFTFSTNFRQALQTLRPSFLEKCCLYCKLKNTEQYQVNDS